MNSFQGLHPIWLEEDVNDAFANQAHNESNWTRSIVSFKPVHSHKNALCVYISGCKSVEKLSDSDVIKECSQLLKKLMANDEIPEPKAILRFMTLIANYNIYFLFYN